MIQFAELLYGPRSRGLDTGVDTTTAILRSLPRLVAVTAVIAGVAFAITFIWPRTYTASTTLIPPQQQQSAASLALQNLGALAGLAGAAGSFKSPIDQYAALLDSRNARLQLVREFDLKSVYDVELDVDALRELGKRTRVSVGRKDGLIAIEVDDRDPERAAAIAAAYVRQLERLTAEFALTEAQQRRVFFQKQSDEARQKVVAAQQALQASGFDESAIRAEPKAVAEAYARLSAEVTAAEVRLTGLRRTLSDQATEVQQLSARLTTLRSKLAGLESSNAAAPGPDYIGRFREFKYQETLFELFSRQLELAKVDESREGPSVQVIDQATVPERHSRPRPVFVTAVTGLMTLGILLLLLLVLRRTEAAR